MFSRLMKKPLKLFIPLLRSVLRWLEDPNSTRIRTKHLDKDVMIVKWVAGPNLPGNHTRFDIVVCARLDPTLSSLNQRDMAIHISERTNKKLTEEGFICVAAWWADPQGHIFISNIGTMYHISRPMGPQYNQDAVTVVPFTPSARRAISMEILFGSSTNP